MLSFVFEATMWTAEARDRYGDDDRRYPGDLTDAECSAIVPMTSGYWTLTADKREIVNACSYLEKAVYPWRFFSKEFGPWQTLRFWCDRFQADGVLTDVAVALMRSDWSRRGRNSEPVTAIMDVPSVASGPQAGVRIVVGNQKVEDIKHNVLTRSLGFVLATLVTTANVHDTAAANLVLDRATAEGW